MEVALSYYSIQGMSIAIATHRFPEDYKHRPQTRVKALRYIFSHRNKYPKSPTIQELSHSANNMFQEFHASNNLELMREVADIMNEFGQANLLDTIREVEEQKNNPTPTIHKQKTVYNDSQNVHNSKINKSVINSVEHLFEKYKHLFILEQTTDAEKFQHKKLILYQIDSILSSKYPNLKTTINANTEYIETSTAIFGKKEISLLDAFISLWFWINDHTHKEELEKRLLEELKEMSGLCTTGHIARLINVIQGFTDDANLLIKISNKDQCTAVVRQYLNNELKNCQDENIIAEMTEGGPNYTKFIRKAIAKKLLEWKKDYGQDMIKTIAETVNEFANTTVFT